MKAYIGPTMKISTSTSANNPGYRLYALNPKGSIIELRLSDTTPRRKVCRMTSEKKVFTQIIFEGGEHVAYTTRGRIYAVLGVLTKIGRFVELTNDQHKLIINLLEKKGKL